MINDRTWLGLGIGLTALTSQNKEHEMWTLLIDSPYQTQKLLALVTSDGVSSTTISFFRNSELQSCIVSITS